ncbi:hypothetical protein NG796_24565 [Laspinema sp. A4]|uniref:hypothetical protein n=1 Tax=Laspinema sp. D2d TaxID=2953686 RepID=UPI0021BB3B3C|nr:hypothetical protein [Laspinema sp. D2d]MCT7986449.1 hypothetical protein [Laspinema sp. D2d]
MTFSKNQINRAGDILQAESAEPTERRQAANLLTAWRLAHGETLHQFSQRIHPLLDLQPEAILAQRIKRLPSIVGKLQRYPQIKLAKMQDLVGMRVIMPTIEAVRNLENSLLSDENLVRHQDYISNPKATGYRGIHCIYQFANETQLELQIRTQQQHLWATAVEMAGVILGVGDGIKTQQISDDWLEFFALVSSAFARLEGVPVVSQHEHLSELELYDAIACLEERLEVLAQLQTVQPVETPVVRVDGDWQLLNLKQQRLTVDCLDWEPAVQRYEQLEQDLSHQQQLVLVSVRLDQLRRAYPNYFLDIQPFAKQLQLILNG